MIFKTFKDSRPLLTLAKKSLNFSANLHFLALGLLGLSDGPGALSEAVQQVLVLPH